MKYFRSLVKKKRGKKRKKEKIRFRTKYHYIMAFIFVYSIKNINGITTGYKAKFITEKCRAVVIVR